MRTTIAATILTLVIPGEVLAAQQTAVGRLEGTIKQTIASRAVSAAQVSLVRLESETSNTFGTQADARGRYRVDSLPAGHYLVQVSHPTLDSLEVALPPVQLLISGGKATRSDFSLPTGARLREVVCPGVVLGPEKAVVAGRVVDAETEAPLPGADVVVVWTDITIDRKARKIATEKKMAVVSTGPRGEYRLCGVPTGLLLSMQLQHAGHIGAATALSVSSAEGVVIRDLSLSTRAAPTIVVLDSLERVAFTSAPDSMSDRDSVSTSDAKRGELELHGDATLAGTVRTSTGRPVSRAKIQVRDAGPSTVTDDAGRFVLGGLPSGTQVLVVRQLGYAPAEIPVELRSGKRVSQNVSLRRAVALDSVRVVASRPPLAEFEYNRRTHLHGHFMSLGEIQRRNAKQTSDLIVALGGHVMMGRGRYVKMMANQLGPPGTVPCRGANVVIDGVEGLAVNDVAPNQIAGIELYKDASSAPVQWAGRANCGLIVIWLRPGPRRRGWNEPKNPAALQYNGYQ